MDSNQINRFKCVQGRIHQATIPHGRLFQMEWERAGTQCTVIALAALLVF